MLELIQLYLPMLIPVERIVSHRGSYRIIDFVSSMIALFAYNIVLESLHVSKVAIFL